MADKGFWGRLTSGTAPPPSGSLRRRGYHLVTQFNVWAYRASKGRVGGSFDGAEMCVLHHRGAKTGEPRQTPLLFVQDGENVVLVASMGGQPMHPAWYHNLRAHPDVEIERGGRRPVRARVAGPEERERLWARAVDVWPAYADYQARTDRVIPVIVCEPRSP